MRFLIAFFTLTLFFSSPVYAACTSPTGVGGSVDYDDTTKTRKICDGTTWKLLEEVDYSTTGARQRLQIAADAGTCSANKTGRLRYDGTATWEYCNGSTWTPFERAASPRGYFVRTASTYNGNLGGLTGANTKCLTELQTTYNWLGKSDAGTLTATRVKAFLCDGTTCNNLQPNTPYIMAKANDLTTGGIGFLTDSNGRGLGYQLDLDLDNWSGTKNYWTNRATVSSEVWATTAKGANHCSNWSTTTGLGHEGNAGWGDARRWDENTESCSATNYLICYVDPQ